MTRDNKIVEKHKANIEKWSVAHSAIVAFGRAAAETQLPLAEKRRIDLQVRKLAQRFALLIRKAQKSILKRDKTPPFSKFPEPDYEDDDADE